MVGADRRADDGRIRRPLRLRATLARRWFLHVDRVRRRRIGRRSRRWPRSTIRRRGSSARSSTCSESGPAGIPIPPAGPARASGRRTTSRREGRGAARVHTTTARPFPSSQVGGRGSLRDPGGAGPRRHHRAGSLPLQRRGRDDHRHEVPALLHPQGDREALRGPDARATASSLPSGCPGTRASGTRSPTARRIEALTRHRRAGPRAVPARDRCSSSSGSTTTSADFGMIANDTGFAVAPLALLPDPRAAPAPEQAA